MGTVGGLTSFRMTIQSCTTTTAYGYGALEGLFTSKERDAETGLDWFGSRYMSSTQGRFTSPDKPFADQDPYDPQSWNLYSYVRNNPLKFIDETGREIVYANNRLRTISDQRRVESPSYNSNLQGYEGPGSPRLTIKYGPTANDPDGSPTNGVFSSQISPPIQNSPPGIHTMPSGAGPAGCDGFARDESPTGWSAWVLAVTGCAAIGAAPRAAFAAEMPMSQDIGISRPMSGPEDLAAVRK